MSPCILESPCRYFQHHRAGCSSSCAAQAVPKGRQVDSQWRLLARGLTHNMAPCPAAPMQSATSCSQLPRRRWATLPTSRVGAHCERALASSLLLQRAACPRLQLTDYVLPFFPPSQAPTWPRAAAALRHRARAWVSTQGGGAAPSWLPGLHAELCCGCRAPLPSSSHLLPPPSKVPTPALCHRAAHAAAACSHRLCQLGRDPPGQLCQLPGMHQRPVRP